MELAAGTNLSHSSGDRVVIHGILYRVRSGGTASDGKLDIDGKLLFDRALLCSHSNCGQAAHAGNENFVRHFHYDLQLVVITCDYLSVSSSGSRPAKPLS